MKEQEMHAYIGREILLDIQMGRENNIKQVLDK
jgi:hypothetical protein